MFRTICAVIVGYLAMTAWVVLAFSLALLKPDFAFEQGSDDITRGWIIYALAMSLVAALLGGFVTRILARSTTGRPVLALAGLVLVLGLISAVANSRREQPGPSQEMVSEAGEMSVLKRASRGRQPSWYAYTLPFLGAIGVLAGGRPGRGAAQDRQAP
jgi:hypothetical protein